MKKFALLFEHIDQTQSTNEKVQYMQEYFASASTADAAWALFFLSGHRMKRFISARMLLDWCIEKIALPPWLVMEAYSVVGDTAEAIALLLPNEQRTAGQDEDLSLSQWMELRILPLYQKSLDEQKAAIFHYWNSLDKKECFILNKLLTGSLRVGVSSLLTLKAISNAYGIPREVLSQRVMGNWDPTPAFFEALIQKGNQGQSLNPYPFFLASPLDSELETLGSPQDWFAEWKWDGIRSQCILRQGQTAIWSRGNELITHQFPEIAEALLSLPDNTVVDGEILAYASGQPLPFGELQRRLGRKNPSKNIIQEVPIHLMLYDLLELEGNDLRKSPFNERRKLLEAFQGKHPRIHLSPHISFNGWDELKEKRLQAKESMTEGLILKKLSSKYGVGRQKGSWWKFKVDPYTLDLVLMYAEGGRGRRANTYTDYTFGAWSEGTLIPIAKAYSGLSQEEINALDRWIRRNTEEKFGPVRKVKAEQVFEIAFEGIQPSNRHKSGVALRFPRIARWRTDKPVDECDTVEKIKETFLK